MGGWAVLVCCWIGRAAERRTCDETRIGESVEPSGAADHGRGVRPWSGDGGGGAGGVAGAAGLFGGAGDAADSGGEGPSEKDGARYVYRATHPRDEASESALRRVVRTFFDGSVEKAVAALLDSSEAEMSADELDRLSRLIDEARKGGR